LINFSVYTPLEAVLTDSVNGCGISDGANRLNIDLAHVFIVHFNDHWKDFKFETCNLFISNSLAFSPLRRICLRLCLLKFQMKAGSKSQA
jgi:hypothetical protein